MNNDNLSERVHCEAILLKFLKIILDINTGTATVAVRCQLSQFPLLISAMEHSLRLLSLEGIGQYDERLRFDTAYQNNA